MQLIKVSAVILYFADDKSAVEKIKYSVKDHTAEKFKIRESVFLTITFNSVYVHEHMCVYAHTFMYINIYKYIYILLIYWEIGREGRWERRGGGEEEKRWWWWL